jgi:hypothetical protein
VPTPWMIYGANRYTGELIAREAVIKRTRSAGLSRSRNCSPPNMGEARRGLWLPSARCRIPTGDGIRAASGAGLDRLQAAMAELRKSGFGHYRISFLTMRARLDRGCRGRRIPFPSSLRQRFLTSTNASLIVRIWSAFMSYQFVDPLAHHVDIRSIPSPMHTNPKR